MNTMNNMPMSVVRLLTTTTETTNIMTRPECVVVSSQANVKTPRRINAMTNLKLPLHVPASKPALSVLP